MTTDFFIHERALCESPYIAKGAYIDAFAYVRPEARIGAHCTIHPYALIDNGVVVGAHARVEAAAVVTRDVPPNAIVAGNPAKITGYVNTTSERSAQRHSLASSNLEPATHNTQVKGVKLHHMRTVPDMRGSLSAGEFMRDIPFSAERYFLVFDVPTAETRGEHAHYACHQFLIAVHGSLRVVTDDGTNRQEFVLDSPSVGLHLPPMVWGIQYDYSPDAVLLVLASDYYDADDYIRDYEQFLRAVTP